MKLITARTFDNPIDAHLLKSKLEDEGITCFLQDEHTITIDPLVSNAIGGIKLKIKEEDIEKVKIIFKKLDDIPYTDNDNNIAKCPKCNSTELIAGYNSMKGFSQILSALISLLLMIYPIHLKRLYKCKKCGTEFKLK